MNFAHRVTCRCVSLLVAFLHYAGVNHSFHPNMGTMDESQIEATQVYKKRWSILVMFVLLSASNAFQWIEYAIITDVIVRFYSVPTVWVNWTSMIYMFAYIPLILPATWMLDKYGLRIVVTLGALGNCIGALIKCFSAAPHLFWLTFVGQTIVGSSQIFILGVPPRLAAVWFGPSQVSTACALGVFGNQLGIAVGFLAPPMLISGQEDVPPATTAAQLFTLFCFSAAINTIALVLILLFFSSKPAKPPSLAQAAAIEAGMESNYVQSIKDLLGNRNYQLLLLTYGINVGVFYAVSTLLNQTVLKYYKGENENVGRIGVLIVFAGMLGSALAGFWLDYSHTYKKTTVGIYFFSFIGMVAYTCTVSLGYLWIVFFTAGFLGFFMTGYLPVGFEYGAELTYPAAEGTQSGLLNASAQVFGVLMTWGMGEVLERVSVFVCNITLTLALLVGTVLTAMIKADLRRQRAQNSEMQKQTAELLSTSDSYPVDVSKIQFVDG